MTWTSRQVRRDIQGLRALAVFSVLVNHAFPKALSGGFVGVDIFFVISGYLIGGQLLQDIHAGRLNILGFYAKRARRLFPALALVLICIWCVGWRFFSAAELADLGRNIAAAVLFSNNVLLWSQSGYFDTSALEKPLLHLWSLGIEEQFYFVVPAILWLGSRGTAGSIRWVARLGALSLATTVIVGNFDYVASFYCLHTRFWELAVGVVLAQTQMQAQPPAVASAPTSKSEVREVLLYSTSVLLFSVIVLGGNLSQWDWVSALQDIGLILAIAGAVSAAYLGSLSLRPSEWSALITRWLQRSETVNSALSIGGITLIVGSFTALTGTNWPGPQTLLPVLGAALVITAGPVALPNRLLSSRTPVYVGGVSYPLYLWHWPCLVVFRLLFPDAILAWALVPLAGSFLLAHLTKVLVEDPIRFGRIGSTVIKRPPLWPVMSGLAAAGFLGFLVISTAHIPSRFSPKVQAVADWSEENLDSWRIGRCYFSANDTRDFSSECTPPRRSGVPLVVLWGDSHAADLYSGLAAIQSSMPVDIAQWTVAGCPPTLRTYRESSSCAAWSARIIAKIAALKPDTIVLAGAWERYLELGRYQAQIMGTLSETVRRLKELGVRRIVVFGPGPLWETSLPVDLFRYMVKAGSDKIPERLGTVSGAIWNLDATMSAWAAASEIRYVSIIGYFCDKTGCLTVGDRGSRRPDLLFRDRDHLSMSGSRSLIEHSRSQVFGRN